MLDYRAAMPIIRMGYSADLDFNNGMLQSEKDGGIILRTDFYDWLKQEAEEC